MGCGDVLVFLFKNNFLFSITLKVNIKYRFLFANPGDQQCYSSRILMRVVQFQPAATQPGAFMLESQAINLPLF